MWKFVTLPFPCAYHFQASALKAMQSVCHLLRPPPCLRRVQQTACVYLSYVLLSRIPGSMWNHISVLIAAIDLFMRCHAADVVSSSFDSSDPITRISCTLCILWSTPFMLISSPFRPEHCSSTHIASPAFSTTVRSVRFSPSHVAPSPAASFCSRPGCSNCPRISCARSEVRHPRPLYPFVCCILVVAPSTPR